MKRHSLNIDPLRSAQSSIGPSSPAASSPTPETAEEQPREYCLHNRLQASVTQRRWHDSTATHGVTFAVFLPRRPPLSRCHAFIAFVAMRPRSTLSPRPPPFLWRLHKNPCDHRLFEMAATHLVDAVVHDERRSVYSCLVGPDEATSIDYRRCHTPTTLVGCNPMLGFPDSAARG